MKLDGDIERRINCSNEHWAKFIYSFDDGLGFNQTVHNSRKLYKVYGRC